MQQAQTTLTKLAGRFNFEAIVVRLSAMESTLHVQLCILMQARTFSLHQFRDPISNVCWLLSAICRLNSRKAVWSCISPYLLTEKNWAPADMVNIPIIYKVSYMSGACLGFLPSTVWLLKRRQEKTTGETLKTPITKRKKNNSQEDKSYNREEAEALRPDADVLAKEKAKEQALKKAFTKDEERKAVERAYEKERMWGLTPPFLKDLLPDSSCSAQYHPINKYFKVLYSSILVHGSLVNTSFGFKAVILLCQRWHQSHAHRRNKAL